MGGCRRSAARPATAAGPLRGRIYPGKRDKLVYNLGYLLVTTDAAPTGTVKLEVEYEMRF